jgi:hypothetical protein
MSKIMLVSGLALLIVMTGPPLVLADDTACPPYIFQRTVDNVIVNGECQIGPNATVRGNVKIVPGGYLALFGPTTIGGNVQSDGGLGFVLFQPGPISIGGNLQATRTGPYTSGYMAGVANIAGSLQWQENSGNLIADTGVIGGTLEVFNSGRGPSIVSGDSPVSNSRDSSIISGNEISGTLQCDGNTPPPISRAVNIVTVNKEGQCSGPGF